ncbi:MAG: metallophosphoesterase [Acidobacteriales bacterium]|nr:metallophosphoesterase [Terriglobales bacterium]
MAVVTRRVFFQGAAAVAAAGFSGGILLSAFGETTHPRLTRLELPLPRLPEAFDGFRIVQLSDFHYDEEFTIVPIRRAMEIANQLQPDLFVLTGDFVTLPVWVDYITSTRKGSARAAEPCAVMLRELKSRLGSYAILGNHDADSDAGFVIESLQANGIQVLRNRAIAIEQNGARLWLAGVDDVINGKPDIAGTLRAIPAQEAIVMLAHEPDFADDVAKFPVDLQLSGHSHWGQVRLPIVGAPMLPDLAIKYPWGLRQIGPMTLYTNAGLGTIRVPMRINAPPEVTEITLRVKRS